MKLISAPWWQDRTAVTTILGAVLAVAVGVADAAHLHVFGTAADTLLIGGGIGALLGHNPLQVQVPGS